ncbi:hypothetical protein [Mycoplasmopsis agassizii]|uniref:IgG-blocking virulence domain-containing protein n=1 Tax=Mycoplasmopsis agassizii TaxID=33922 RepID=A0ABX4H5E0_9BACT|nr:hypothetical protein [Mycoplasmopsis agassizii]PAF55073.1 hypothetical protein CJF60_00070 [Mycoplasmopsis agassizii]SMC19080.1 putative immunoglobulin-blocking virulence protein [Mycoplasmopsis agassizii]
MNLRSKIIIALSIATVAAVGGTTAGLVIGLNRQEDSKTGVDFNSLASVKKIDYQKALSDPEVKMKEVKPPEKPEEVKPTPPAPKPKPEEKPEPEPTPIEKKEEPKKEEPVVTPEPKKEEIPSLPKEVVPEKSVSEDKPENQPAATSGTSTYKLLTTKELIEQLRDHGESAARVKDFKTVGGVGTNLRRSGKNSTVAKPDKFDYESLSAGSQDSAIVLGALIRDGVTLDNLPTLKEPISLQDLNSLRENSLRYVEGTRVLKLEQKDLDQLLKEYNENLKLELGDFINGIRFSFNDVERLNKKYDVEEIKAKYKRDYKSLTEEEKNIFYVNERIEKYANDPNTSFIFPSIKSFKDIKPKKSFTSEEVTRLEMGQVPNSFKVNGQFGSTATKRAAFVNDVLFRTTQQNMNRYFGFTSNWERTENDVMNLEFRAWKGEATNSGYEKAEPITIPGFENSARLLEYKNLSSTSSDNNRYIIEIFAVQNLSSVNSLVNAAKKLMKNQKGAGIAIRNINPSTGEKAKEVVKNMPNFIKSLTLFYDWNDPVVVHALIDNLNFNTTDKTLVELNLYTDVSRNIDMRNTAVERSTSLTRIDPRVYQRVNPGAYDYKYNAIFLTLAVGKPTTRREIGQMMRYVYVIAKNRREFQGYFGGEGGYPVMWDFRDANMYEMNNIEIPNIPNFKTFTKVTFSSLINGKAIYDLTNLKIDNTEKVELNFLNPNTGMHYANTTPLTSLKTNTFNTLVVVGSSGRGTSADANTISNHMLRSYQYLNAIDFRDETVNGELHKTEMTEEIIKSITWPFNVRKIMLQGKEITGFSKSAQQ